MKHQYYIKYTYISNTKAVILVMATFFIGRRRMNLFQRSTADIAAWNLEGFDGISDERIEQHIARSLA